MLKSLIKSLENKTLGQTLGPFLPTNWEEKLETR
jgi:hypothetical protein